MSSEDIDFSCNPSEFNPYQILNVTPDATIEEIQESYKKLSKTFHPDKSYDDINKNVSRQQFESITKAKDILCDTEIRKIYDDFGIKGIQMMKQNIIYNDLKSMQIGKQYRNNDAIQHLLKYYLKRELCQIIYINFFFY